MNPLNQHPADTDDWHDVVANAVAVQRPTDSDWSTPPSLRRLYSLLPVHIQAIAQEWGASDTVFRDFAYEWLRDNWENIQT